MPASQRGPHQSLAQSISLSLFFFQSSKCWIVVSEMEGESNAILGETAMVIICLLSKRGYDLSVLCSPITFPSPSCAFKEGNIPFFQGKNLVSRRCLADSWLKRSVMNGLTKLTWTCKSLNCFFFCIWQRKSLRGQILRDCTWINMLFHARCCSSELSLE